MGGRGAELWYSRFRSLVDVSLELTLMHLHLRLHLRLHPLVILCRIGEERALVPAVGHHLDRGSGAFIVFEEARILRELGRVRTQTLVDADLEFGLLRAGCARWRETSV